MSLITCPECGRCEISSTAEYCPHCGYGIKKHFELEQRRQENARLIAEQEKRRLEYEQKKQIALEKLQPELEQNLKEVDDMPYPAKPRFFEGTVGKCVLWVIGAIVFFYLLVIWFDNEFWLTPMVISILLLPFLLWARYSEYSSEVQHRNETISKWEDHKEKKRKEIRDTYKSYADNIARYGYRNAPSSSSRYSYTPRVTNIPKCPVCGATNIKKLSTMKKMGSVYVAGLASDSIGKQMQCVNCGYKF